MAGSGLGYAACQSKNFFVDRMFLRNKYRQTGTKATGNRELSYELLPFAYAQTTVCVCPNNRSRTPKQPFGYTQTLLLNFFEGHPRGTLLGPWCPRQHTRNQRVMSNRGTGGTLFSCFSHGIYYGEGWMVKGGTLFFNNLDGPLSASPHP